MALVFVGNSGAARECYWLWTQCAKSDPQTPPFKGFLAWQGHKGELRGLRKFFLGDSGDYQFQPDDQFVVAVGKPLLRLRIYEWLKARGASLYTLKHPAAYLCPSASIGEGNIIAGGCAVLADASIGNVNFLNGAVTIGHDSALGDANTCNQYSSFFGDVHVGSCNLFAPMALVLEHARIGSHNTFAPASVVYRGCGDYCHMAGNPALIERRHEAATNGAS